MNRINELAKVIEYMTTADLISLENITGIEIAQWVRAFETIRENGTQYPPGLENVRIRVFCKTKRSDWDGIVEPNKIQVIKELRSLLGCGLKEAKDISEGTIHTVFVDDLYNLRRSLTKFDWDVEEVS